MRSGFLKGDFQLPTLHEPAQHLLGAVLKRGAQQCLRLEPAAWARTSTHRIGTTGMPLWQPDGGAGSKLDAALAFAIPSRDGEVLPHRSGVCQLLGPAGIRPAAHASYQITSAATSAALFAGTQPGGEHLAIPAAELPLKPPLRQLRGHHRGLLRGLKPPDRTTRSCPIHHLTRLRQNGHPVSRVVSVRLNGQSRARS
jgi:hypothetical protein